MNYSRPCIKDIYPIYKLSDTMFRIGAQINITTEFNDPTGELWELVTRLNGTELNIIFKEMKELFPNITLSAIEYGIDLLANEGLIEEFGQNDSVDDRYMSNVNYFRRYLDSYEDSLAVQKKINNSSILLLGLGGGGSNILTLLAGLGPKKLTIVDYDRVERNNLGRQMLYKESDIGELKTVVAKREFEKMNSSVKLTTIDKKINFNPPTVAYGPAIFQLSGAIVDEAIRILTNFCIPMSKSTRFEINYETGASFTHKPWPRFKECPTCGHGNSNDWEIFSHYG